MNIEYVDELPMVNLTNAFLVKKEAVLDFNKGQERFFAYWKEHYFWPRMLKVHKGEKVIQLFSITNKRNERRYIPSKVAPKYLGDIENQREIGHTYMVDVHSPDMLREKLSKRGLRLLGFALLPTAFNLSNYEELFEYLIGERTLKRSNSGLVDTRFTLMRHFAIYLQNTGYYLWPLLRFEKEPSWNAYATEYRLLFRQSFRMIIEEAMPPHKIRHFNSHSIKLLRAVKWSSFGDMNDEDVSSLYKKLRDKTIDPNYYLSTTLFRLVDAAIDQGAGLTFVSKDERAGMSRSRGRLDGSFSYLNKHGEKFKNWADKARDYVLERKRDGLQAIEILCANLNYWFDYLVYLDSKGRSLQSLSDISRAVHIEYRPSTHPDLHSFTEWLHDIAELGPDAQSKAINVTEAFFNWIIDIDGLAIRNPIKPLTDAPKRKDNSKSYRAALTIAWWLGLIDMLFNDPPPFFETVKENYEIVQKNNPSLSTYMLIRLMHGIRHHQAVYLDKDTIIHQDGFVISGDKNPNREFLQITPVIDDRLKVKIRQCIEWQEKYNYPAKPVSYNKRDNSPYGKVSPFIRLINRTGNPLSRQVCDLYMMRAFLKYQKISKISPEEYIVVRKDKQPFDISSINPDTMATTNIEQDYVSLFDLHSLRVTAATIWYEAGLPLEVIAEFITGHATMTMLMKYVKIRDAKHLIQERYNALKERMQIEEELETDRDAAIKKFFLTSRVIREQDKYFDGIKLLKETPIAFWRYRDYGICPTGACLAELPDKCSLCPQFITAPVPAYMNAIAAQINLTLEKIGVVVSEIQTSHMKSENRQAEMEMLLQELVGWHGWYGFLSQKLKERASNSGNGSMPTLYTQLEYEPKRVLQSTLQIQRAYDIMVIPGVYSKEAYYVLKEKLERFFANLNPGVSSHDIINNLSPEEVSKKVVEYHLHLIERGLTEQEIDMLCSNKIGDLIPLELRHRLINIHLAGGYNGQENTET